MNNKSRLIFLLLFCLSTEVLADTQNFRWQGKEIELLNKSNSISATKDGEIIFDVQSNQEEEGSIKIEDMNFDGYPDFFVPRDFGIERYFDVYIFNKKKGEYLLDEFLSKLACPESIQNNKTVISSCNQSNACEHWQDTYRLKRNKYQIILKEGTSCNPVTGEGFKYIEKYNNGKKIWQRSFPIQ